MRVLRLSLHLDWRAVQPDAGPHAARHLGGQTTQVTRLTRALDARGVRQLVVTAPLPGGPRRGRLGGSTVVALGTQASGAHALGAAWAAATLAHLPRLGRDADVVHVHADGLVESVALAALARAVACRPLVLTLHSSAQATYVPVSRRDAAVQVVNRAVERRALTAADRTLVLTERTRSALAAQGRLEVVPDAVEGAHIAALASAGRADRAAWRTRFGLAADQRLVLFVGRLDENKGAGLLPGLADALAGDRAALLACGDGPLGEELRAAAIAHPQRLAVPGYVAQDEVYALLGAADVLVLPTRHEELGSVLLEAQAAGLPCVATAVGGTGEALADQTTGVLVAPEDPAALVAGVRRALDDPALRAGAVREGPLRVRRRFDVEAIADRVLDVYNQVSVAAVPRR